MESVATMNDYEVIARFSRSKRKQALINFFERLDMVDWKFYERGSFFTVEVFFTDEYNLRRIFETMPHYFHAHINAKTNRLEVFTDAD